MCFSCLLASMSMSEQQLWLDTPHRRVPDDISSFQQYTNIQIYNITIYLHIMMMGVAHEILLSALGLFRFSILDFRFPVPSPSPSPSRLTIPRNCFIAPVQLNVFATYQCYCLFSDPASSAAGSCLSFPGLSWAAPGPRLVSHGSHSPRRDPSHCQSQHCVLALRHSQVFHWNLVSN